GWKTGTALPPRVGSKATSTASPCRTSPGAAPTTFDTMRIPSSSSTSATTGGSVKPTGAGWRGTIQLYTTPRPGTRTSVRPTRWQRGHIGRGGWRSAPQVVQACARSSPRRAPSQKNALSREAIGSGRVGAPAPPLGVLMSVPSGAPRRIGRAGRSLPQQLLGDDELAHLARARADLEQLDRAVKAVHLGLPDVGGAAVDLRGVVEHAVQSVGAEEDRRGGEPVRGAAPALLPAEVAERAQAAPGVAPHRVDV